MPNFAALQHLAVTTGCAQQHACMLLGTVLLSALAYMSCTHVRTDKRTH
jgi:hypothetical protein